MFRLKEKEIRENNERLTYCSDEFIDPMKIVEAMENSDFPIKEVYLSEEADVGFYYFGGTYSVEKAKELYPKVKDDVKSVCIHMKYGCDILIKENILRITYPSNITFNIGKYINLN